ncbi:MAG TPA: branched-chain amino acid aminotransferase [Puia sp.]|nr:branched-chain amino acid aminotransferase [Puia sp.]
MIDTQDIQITKVKRSKIDETDFGNLPFGKHFTDHMLEVDFIGGTWRQISIKPYQPFMFDPSLAALHYGQAIFEGIKAYKSQAGNAFIFRPYDNFKRFNLSAARMEMPIVPEDIFIEGMRVLVAIDKDWIPAREDYSLYIRPLMFATDTAIGVRPSDTYKFVIILSPTGPYYAHPMKIYVEEKYSRAAPGGIGFAKNAGNYGGSMYPTSIARRRGYDQVLWTDCAEHKWLQEVGTMNIFFITAENKAITPSLDEGTILDGVTRSTVITLLSEMGVMVEQRKINIEEIIDYYSRGQLQEVFGTGTAATISPVQELKYRETVMTFDPQSWKTAPRVKKILAEIRQGKREDSHGWLFPI